MIVRVIALLALVAMSACVGPDSSARYAHHFDGAPWSSGFGAQFDDPWQYGAEAALLVATPIAFALDDELADDALDNQYVSKGNTSSGDAIATGLGIASVAYGGWKWADGDHGERFEVAGEALVATGLVTQTLKTLTQRERPQSTSSDAFPSGHTSLAFCGATFLARSIEQDTDSKLGYLLWLPASYVAVDRVEAGRHWASDVVVGALLGTVLTNWIWNAHYGEPGAAAIFDDGAIHARWQPQVSWSGEAMALGLDCSF